MAFRDHVTPLRLSTALPAEVSISPAQNEPLYSPVQWEERCLRHLCNDWVKNTWQKGPKKGGLAVAHSLSVNWESIAAGM